MPAHHFISYSTIDALDFALRLCDALVAGPPSFQIWLDKRQLRPGEDWDEQLAEAIRHRSGGIDVISIRLHSTKTS